MFGPPCHNCGSETDWLIGKEAEECSCGWPHNKVKKKVKFGDTALGDQIGTAFCILALFLGLAALIYVMKL